MVFLIRTQLPDAIPYVTSYYADNWGFCVTKEFKDSLKPGQYRVKIHAKKFSGSMSYGELIIAGESDKQILFSTYICHPSLANNELSGPALCAYLAKKIQNMGVRRYTYKFLFIPETIGSIYYLSKNLSNLRKKLLAGFVVTCVGDPGKFSYMPSRTGNTYADKVALHALKNYAKQFTSYTYLERGSDERQYCSPGVDLPVCSVMKTKYGEYPEYHSSHDNLEFISSEGLSEAYSFYVRLIETIESDKTLVSNIKCEPMLGKRGLYSNIGDGKRHDSAELLLNIHAYSDGKNSLLDIAEILKKPIWEISEGAQTLLDAGIIRKTKKLFINKLGWIF
jgi:aminopeptidase-like protein